MFCLSPCPDNKKKVFYFVLCLCACLWASETDIHSESSLQKLCNNRKMPTTDLPLSVCVCLCVRACVFVCVCGKRRLFSVH